MADRVKCADCGETLHQVPGGHGPVWVNPGGYAACLASDGSLPRVPHAHRPEATETVLTGTGEKSLPIDTVDRLYAYRSGQDPDRRACPECGTLLDEDGYCVDVGCSLCGKTPPPESHERR
jgi:hypothetical protein